MNPIRKLLAALLLALSVSGAVAQNDAQIREQKRIIASLEKRIAAEEREISKLRQGRTSTEERIRRLARQIDSRTQLLDATEKEASLLREEIARKDSVAGGLSAALERNREQYAAMVREAYRNYRHNNYLTYIFSSRDFADAARRIANLRAVASMRESKLRDIRSLSEQVRTEQEELGRRKLSLDSAMRRNGCNSTRATPGPASAGSRRRRKRPCNARSRRSSSSTRPSANCANSPKATRRAPRSHRRPRDCAFRCRAAA